MTKFYKVEPKYKKSVYEYSTYESEDEKIKFTIEEMYRWGHVVIKVEDDEELSDIIGDPNDANNEFEFDHTMVEDQEVDDQCSFYFNDVQGMSIEELEEKYDENGHDYLLDTFGEPVDFYTVYQGELEVKEVTQWVVKEVNKDLPINPSLM